MPPSVSKSLWEAIQEESDASRPASRSKLGLFAATCIEYTSSASSSAASSSILRPPKRANGKYRPSRGRYRKRVQTTLRRTSNEDRDRERSKSHSSRDERRRKKKRRSSRDKKSNKLFSKHDPLSSDYESDSYTDDADSESDSTSETSTSFDSDDDDDDLLSARREFSNDYYDSNCSSYSEYTSDQHTSDYHDDHNHSDNSAYNHGNNQISLRNKHSNELSGNYPHNHLHHHCGDSSVSESSCYYYSSMDEGGVNMQEQWKMRLTERRQHLVALGTGRESITESTSISERGSLLSISVSNISRSKHQKKVDRRKREKKEKAREKEKKKAKKNRRKLKGKDFTAEMKLSRGRKILKLKSEEPRSKKKPEKNISPRGCHEKPLRSSSHDPYNQLNLYDDDYVTNTVNFNIVTKGKHPSSNFSLKPEACSSAMLGPRVTKEMIQPTASVVSSSSSSGGHRESISLSDSDSDNDSNTNRNVDDDDEGKSCAGSTITSTLASTIASTIPSRRSIFEYTAHLTNGDNPAISKSDVEGAPVVKLGSIIHGGRRRRTIPSGEESGDEIYNYRPKIDNLDDIIRADVNNYGENEERPERGRSLSLPRQERKVYFSHTNAPVEYYTEDDMHPPIVDSVEHSPYANHLPHTQPYLDPVPTAISAAVASCVSTSPYPNVSSNVIFYACDELTGRCIFHPDVQLRKRARFGGWKDVLRQCPKCLDVSGAAGDGNILVPSKKNSEDTRGGTTRNRDNDKKKPGESWLTGRGRGRNRSSYGRDDEPESGRRTLSKSLPPNSCPTSFKQRQLFSFKSPADGDRRSTFEAIEQKISSKQSSRRRRSTVHTLSPSRPVVNPSAMPSRSGKVPSRSLSFHENGTYTTHDNHNHLQNGKLRGILSSSRRARSATPVKYMHTDKQITFEKANETLPTARDRQENVALRSSLRYSSNSAETAARDNVDMSGLPTSQNSSRKHRPRERLSFNETIEQNPRPSEELESCSEDDGRDNRDANRAYHPSWAIERTRETKDPREHSKRNKSDKERKKKELREKGKVRRGRSGGVSTDKVRSGGSRSKPREPEEEKQEKQYVKGTEESNLNRPKPTKTAPHQILRWAMGEPSMGEPWMENHVDAASSMGPPYCSPANGDTQVDERASILRQSRSSSDYGPSSRAGEIHGIENSDDAPIPKRSQSFHASSSSTAENRTRREPRLRRKRSLSKERIANIKEFSPEELMCYATAAKNARERSSSRERGARGQKEDAPSAVAKDVSISKEDHEDPQIYHLREMGRALASRRGSLEEKPKLSVNHLPWTGSGGLTGLYSGEVNYDYIPHGHGVLVLTNGSSLQGEWVDGYPLPKEETGHSKTQTVINDDSASANICISQAKPGAQRERNDGENDLPSYSLGDEGKREDMVRDGDKESAFKRISKLQAKDKAFIRRTNGTWTYARVKKATPEAIIFFVNMQGSTKSYDRKYWGTHVRMPKVRSSSIRRCASTYDTRSFARSSSIDSRVSSAESTTYDDGAEDKNTDPTRSRRRFSGLNLRSLTPRKSKGKSDVSVSADQNPSPPSPANLRTGRLSFMRKKNRNEHRTTSFSPLRCTPLAPSIKEVSEESDGANYNPTRSNFDASDTITGRGYGLRGIDP